MLVVVFLFVGGAALAFSTGGIFVGLAADREVERDMALLLVVVAFLLWGLWGLSAFDVTVATGGSIEHLSYPALAFLAAGIAFIHLLFAYHLAVGSLRPDGEGVFG